MHRIAERDYRILNLTELRRFANLARSAMPFEKLVRREFGVAGNCIHNRARLYLVHGTPRKDLLQPASLSERRVDPQL